MVVDGAQTRERAPERWTDAATSPIALADRGLLLLVDVGALPPDVQRIVGRAHAERRLPWSADAPVEFSLVVTSRVPLAELVATGRLDPALAGRLTDAASASLLPRLRDRPEDLRAILSERLAREGLRARGAPVGIDDSAFVRLLEYPFDGEDHELSAMAQRLVAACDGDVIRPAHIDALLGIRAARPGDSSDSSDSTADVVERPS